MTSEQLARAIESLPAEDQRQVADFVAYLRFRTKPRLGGSPRRRPLSQEPFIGMWKDREDMQDGGAAWVRRLREREWTRARPRPDPD